MRLTLLIGLAVMATSRLCAGEPAPTSETDGDYRLQPGDTVRIQIYQEPDLDREIRVSKEGEIFLPLIGRLIVKDETIRRVEKVVHILYDKKYLVNPQVNITVVKYHCLLYTSPSPRD